MYQWRIRTSCWDTPSATDMSMDTGWPMPQAPLLTHVLILAPETAEKDHT